MSVCCFFFFFSLTIPWFHQTGCFILNVNHFTWKVVIPNFLPILLVLDAYFFHYSQLWCCVRTIFLLWLLFFRSIYRPLLCSKGSKNWDWMHIYLQNVITITFQQHLILDDFSAMPKIFEFWEEVWSLRFPKNVFRRCFNFLATMFGLCIK